MDYNHEQYANELYSTIYAVLNVNKVPVDTIRAIYADAELYILVAIGIRDIKIKIPKEAYLEGNITDFVVAKLEKELNLK